MDIVLTYKAQTKTTRNTREKLDATLEYYQNMLTYLIPIIEKEYSIIEHLTNQTDKRAIIEHLIHATNQHPNPKYAYDQKYPRCPSYLRRGAITDAIGIYESWLTRHEEWETGELDSGEPQLSYHHTKSPTFYKNNMHREEHASELATIQLKLYNGRDWEWCPISLNTQDVKYIDTKRRYDGSMGCPKIVKKGKKYELHFPMKYTSTLTDENIDNERICAIDLGVNTDATCVIMESDGTVIARKFIKLASEKARLSKKLGLIRKAQSKGARSLRKKWRRVNDLNGEIARKTVRAIMDFAIAWSCTSIVCEFLDAQGKIRGSRKQRLALWRKREVYHRLYDQCHVWGMRIHQVCAWNTSRLAFDGSGRVERGGEICDVVSGESLGYGYSMVRFGSGKLYNADLNAALNIGARYFVRSILKACPVMDESPLRAKVLGAAGGSTVVLSSLINLRRALELGHALESALPSEVWESLCAQASLVLLGPCR